MRGFNTDGVSLFILLLSASTSCDGQVQEVIQDGCSLIMDGEEDTALKLTTTENTNDITVSGWGCDLTLLIVGGGAFGN